MLRLIVLVEASRPWLWSAGARDVGCGDARRAGGRPRAAAVSSLVAFALVVGCLLPAGAVAAFSWSTPRLIDHQSPFAFPGQMSSVSCPSASLCAAVDPSGDVVVSTKPTSGKDAWTVTRTSSQLGTAGPPGVVPSPTLSCASTSLCVAVGSNGLVLTSTDPTGAAGSWHSSTVGQPMGCYKGECRYSWLVGVSCVPGTSMCAALDDQGDVLTSTDPTNGSSWNTAHVDAANRLLGVSCASASLCVAVDGAGNVLSSTDPTGGASAWSMTNIDGARSLSGVACPSAVLCVAVDDAGTALSSTDPTGGGSTWSTANIDGATALSAVSCASSALCVGVDQAGDALSTNNPAGGAGAWRAANIDGANPLSGVSCAESGLCIAVDNSASVLSTSDPTGGAAAWSAAYIDFSATDAPSGMSCPSVSLCVGVDRSGNVVTSRHPRSWPLAWRVANVDGHNALRGVSCPSERLCVAVDAVGNVITSANPTGGPSAWTVERIGSRFDGLASLSCPLVALCVAVDGGGNVLSSTDPAGGASAWKTFRAPQADSSLSAVSCASRSFCVAIGPMSHALISTNPTGGLAAWRSVEVDRNGPSSVSCPSISLCVIIDGRGNALTSANAAARHPTWTTTPLGDGAHSVTCNSPSLCVASDYTGNIYMANPTDRGAWRMRSVDRSSPAGTLCGTILQCNGLSSMSCPSASTCVGTDSLGNVLVAHNPGPASISPPKISGRPAQGNVLTAKRAKWSNPPTKLRYQWELCNTTGVGCSPIKGATHPTYRPTADDSKHTIRVNETARNAQGTGAAASSSPTRTITKRRR